MVQAKWTYWRHDGSESHIRLYKRPKNPSELDLTEITRAQYEAHVELAPVGEDVEVFVPSRSRPQRSLTLEALQYGNVASRTVLVVPHAQGHAYLPLARRMGVKQVLRCPVNGIAATREFIGQRAVDKFVMLDDDLRFYRRNKDSTALHKFSEYDMHAMLILISRLLDHYVHVAVSARGGNNQLDFPFIHNSRPLRVLAYRKHPFVELEHKRVGVMEDFDITLQLLARGHRNVVITEYAQDQLMTQISGGCSDYRTKAVHEANVRRMAKLHPGIVETRQKTNKTGGDFGSRLEATIYWTRAYKQAVEELF